MKIDIIIGIVPVARTCPQTGPALIKSYIESKGYRCKIIDWSIDLYSSITKEDWDLIEADQSKSNINYIVDKYPQIFERWVSNIKALDPEWLGFSVFARRCTNSFVRFMCELFKREIPDIKIVIGGHATTPITDEYKEMLDSNLCDKIVFGEGEIAVEKILKGCDEKIVECDPIENLRTMPFADYYDLDLDKYSSDLMLIVSSRGCINKCKFCYKFCEGYRYRGGVSIAEEMLSHYINFGVTHFYVSDACSNANIKEFKLLINKIISYNELGILPPIKWRTQLSCRSKSDMDEEFWRTIKKSGFDSLSFGLETGSERLRYEMGKRVKNEDIEFLFTQCYRNKIWVSVSMISGYYTETEEDLEETFKFIKKWAYDTPAIKEINFGGMLNLEEGSYLHTNKDELGITLDKYDNWVYKENDYPYRYKRWLKLKKFMDDLGINYKQVLELIMQKEIKHYE